jgi:hypothetical protein
MTARNQKGACRLPDYAECLQKDSPACRLAQSSVSADARAAVESCLMAAWFCSIARPMHYAASGISVTFSRVS